jgi:hypothetical protein
MRKTLWVIEPSDEESIHEVTDTLIGEYRYGSHNHKPSCIYVNECGIGIALSAILKDAGLPVENFSRIAGKSPMITIPES